MKDKADKTHQIVSCVFIISLHIANISSQMTPSDIRQTIHSFFFPANTHHPKSFIPKYQLLCGEDFAFVVARVEQVVWLVRQAV